MICKMEEIWKDIQIKKGEDIIDFTGFYQVSNLGNIRSLDRVVTYSDGRKYHYTGGPHSTNKRKRDGYVYVRFDKNQIVYTGKLHRIVAGAFIPNPDNKPEVDHINGRKDDNRVENLRWVTRRENVMNPTTREQIRRSYPSMVKKMLETRKRIGSKRAEREIIQFDTNGAFIQEHKSIMEIHRALGYDPSSIVKCCKGKQKTCNGYVWKYKDQNK